MGGRGRRDRGRRGDGRPGQQPGGGALDVALDVGAAAGAVLQDHVLEHEDLAAEHGGLGGEGLVDGGEGGFVGLEVLDAALFADAALAGGFSVALAEAGFFVVSSRGGRSRGCGGCCGCG